MSPAASSHSLAADSVIAAEHLTRVYAGPRGAGLVRALTDVSFEVKANTILGIVGTNGAGKTTLLDLLATTVAPSAGTARVAGHDLLRETQAVRRAIGYVPAGGRALYPRLTVARNLHFFAALYGLSGVRAAARISAALQTFAAEEVAHVRVDRVSDGMLARVALTRATLHDPTVLLLDEPVRSVDPIHRRVVLGALRRFADRPGKAAIIVTHAVDDVLEVCDRVMALRAGRLVQEAAVARGAWDRELIERSLGGEVLA